MLYFSSTDSNHESINQCSKIVTQIKWAVVVALASSSPDAMTPTKKSELLVTADLKVP